MRMPRASQEKVRIDLYGRPATSRGATRRIAAFGLAAIVTAGATGITVGGLVIAGGAAPALAQTADTADLRRQVEQLKRQVRALQRNLQAVRADVRQGSSARPGARKISQEEIPPTVAARFEVRMGQLERAIRKLTGKVEDLAFSIRRARKDIKKQENDFSYRLDQLEKSGRTASAAGAGGTARPTTGRVAPPTRRATADSGAGDGGAKTSVLPDGPAAVQYRYAYTLARRRENEKAILAFKEFVEKHPRSRLAGNAYYWLGQLHYNAKNFKDAARAFAAGYQKFRRHARAADNLLMLGVSLSHIDQKNLACKSFAELRSSFPNAAPDVRRRALRESRRLGCR